MLPSDLDPFALAARKYRDFPGNPERVYRALCYALSDRATQVDWDAFTADDWRILPPMAEAEGVAPLMYAALRAMCEARSAKCDVPEGVSAQLKAGYYRTAAHNALLLRELERILDAFEQAGIDVVLLKGAALAQTVYPDPALRPMSDLDLLVRKEFLPIGKQIIIALGYKEIRAEYLGLAPWLDEAMNHHVHLQNETQKQVIVELHWGIIAGDVDRRSPSTEWLWMRTQPFETSAKITPRTQVFQLTPVALILHSAAHLILQHGKYLSWLLWLYDLHLLVSKYYQEIDWGMLLEDANDLHWIAALHSALENCQELFATPLPKDYLSVLKKHGTKQDWQLVVSMNTRSHNRLVETLQYLPTLPWRVRGRLILALLFPAPKYMRYRYEPNPEWLWFLFYLYRWGEVASDGVRMIWNLLFHQQEGECRRIVRPPVA